MIQFIEFFLKYLIITERKILVLPTGRENSFARIMERYVIDSFKAAKATDSYSKEVIFVAEKTDLEQNLKSIMDHSREYWRYFIVFKTDGWIVISNKDEIRFDSQPSRNVDLLNNGENKTNLLLTPPFSKKITLGELIHKKKTNATEISPEKPQEISKEILKKKPIIGTYHKILRKRKLIGGYFKNR